MFLQYVLWLPSILVDHHRRFQTCRRWPIGLEIQEENEIQRGLTKFHDRIKYGQEVRVSTYI